MSRKDYILLAKSIKENKADIDRTIKSVCPNCRLNNEERILWILNDEGSWSYNWARSEGVKI